MGALEIEMTIKCGECITHCSFSLKRDNLDNVLKIADTINSHHIGYFKASQSYPDAIHIECTQCGHEDELSL